MLGTNDRASDEGRLLKFNMSSPPKSLRSQISNYGSITPSNQDRESDASSSRTLHGTDYISENGSREAVFDRERRKSLIEEDADPLQIEPPTMKKKEETVTWSSLPQKSQLTILTIARLAEPLVQTSLRVSTSLSSTYCTISNT